MEFDLCAACAAEACLVVQGARYDHSGSKGGFRFAACSAAIFRDVVVVVRSTGHSHRSRAASDPIGFAVDDP